MIFILIQLILPVTAHSADWTSFYRAHFGLKDPYQKLVGNTGEGFDALYGVRNFRVVLDGIQYRGGANNSFNRTAPRSNMNPLPAEGLQRLCEQGFGLAIYLYAENFEKSEHEFRCNSIRGPNTLRYIQVSPLANEAEAFKILKHIRDTLEDYRHGPIYTHCWNGWHASGYISALSLRQFCGWSVEQAVDYWDRNTDGVNTEPAYEKVRIRIRNFVPAKELQISDALRASVCPVL